MPIFINWIIRVESYPRMHFVSVSKNNNTSGREQSLSAMRDHRVDFYALDAYLLYCTLCVVISRSTHCLQTVHFIIFCPISEHYLHVTLWDMGKLFEMIGVISHFS